MTEKVFLSDIKPKQAPEKRFQFLAKSAYAVAEFVGFVADYVRQFRQILHRGCGRFCRFYVGFCRDYGGIWRIVADYGELWRIMASKRLLYNRLSLCVLCALCGK